MYKYIKCIKIMDKLSQSDNATIEQREMDLMDEGSKKMLIDAIENHSEPYISELREVFKKYPKQCEEQDRLIQDAINRSYRKL